jgi:hypothetical protein
MFDFCPPPLNTIAVQDIHDVSQHLNLYLFVIKIMQEYCKWPEEQWIFFPKKKKQSTYIMYFSTFVWCPVLCVI